MVNQELLMSYYQNPVNNYVMQDFSISRSEGNLICWDSIIIYCKIKDNLISERSFAWQTSIITTAAAGFFSEIIIWNNLDDILKRNKDIFISHWFDVSIRRQRAMVMPLVATINWINTFKKLWTLYNLDDYI